MLLWISLVFFLAVSACAVYIYFDRAFDKIPELNIEARLRQPQSPIRIAAIGDSWAAGQKLDKTIQAAVDNAGFNCTLESSGHPGANSRQILRDLRGKSGDQFSCPHFINDENVEYLVILCGVNDSNSHIGKAFYAHHTTSIVRLAQNAGIFPIVVEIPEYGIEQSKAMGGLSYAKRLIYRILFDATRRDVIASYRAELRQALLNTAQPELALVSFDSVIEDYATSLDKFANPTHLTSSGYELLAKVIAHDLIKEIRARHPARSIQRL